MSRENVEIVRRSIEEWERRDLQALMACYHSDAEVDWSRSRGPFKGVYRGRRRLEEFWNVLWSTFDEGHVEIHSITDTGSVVVVTNTAHFRGRDGIEVIGRSAFLVTVENRKITCLRLFQEPAEALEAAGLSE
jgi:ketosteroid isomerase-like protein